MDESEKASGENILSFYSGDVPPWTMRSNREFCDSRCKRVHVVEKLRMLECQDCKRTIDPFDYVMRWALEGDSRLRSLKELDAEIRKRNVELNELKIDISNAKARLKSALAD